MTMLDQVVGPNQVERGGIELVMSDQEMISEDFFDRRGGGGMAADLFAIVYAPFDEDCDDGGPFQPRGQEGDPLEVALLKSKPGHHFQKERRMRLPEA